MENKMILIPVPLELMTEVGIRPFDVIQFYVEDNSLIIEKAIDTDFKCDEHCANCPLFEPQCDLDCENCPNSDNCNQVEG